MTYERVISIGRDHPSLAGHFPGRPIVPGVVLLREVVETVRRGVPSMPRVAGFPMVKFSSPLKPDELVTIEVDQDAAGRASFSCRVEGRRIASGVIEYAPEAAHAVGA
jgi:3-hydroxymyristoyl/3-hydroxydecanoyl-(acyl carrier protein) dehydratase